MQSILPWNICTHLSKLKHCRTHAKVQRSRKKLVQLLTPPNFVWPIFAYSDLIRKVSSDKHSEKSKGKSMKFLKFCPPLACKFLIYVFLNLWHLKTLYYPLSIILHKNLSQNYNMVFIFYPTSFCSVFADFMQLCIIYTPPSVTISYTRKLTSDKVEIKNNYFPNQTISN